MTTALETIKSELRVDSNGIGYCSIRGAARLAGVTYQTLSRGVSVSSYKLRQKLTAQGFEVAAFATNGIPDTALAVVLEYYAFDAGVYVTEQSKLMYKALAAVGIRELIQRTVGWEAKPAIALPSYAEALRQLADSLDREEQLKLEAAANAPKVELANDYIDRDGLTLIGDFAKDVGLIGRNNLFAMLREKDILCWNNHPKQKYVNKGFFVLKPAGHIGSQGRETFTTLLTPAGVQWLNEQLKVWLA